MRIPISMPSLKANLSRFDGDFLKGFHGALKTLQNNCKIRPFRNLGAPICLQLANLGRILLKFANQIVVVNVAIFNIYVCCGCLKVVFNFKTDEIPGPKITKFNIDFI